MTLHVSEPSAKYLVWQSPQAAAFGELPHDWTLVKLIDVAEVRGGVAKNANVAISDPIEVAYLRVANVQDGYLDLGDVSKIKINKADLKRYSLLPGDVLMNEGGDLDKLGRGALWRGEIETCVHQNHVFSVRCKQQLLGDYLNVWTGSASARRFFLLAGKQTTNLASISKTSLGEMPVFLPRLEEQRAIATALSDVDALIAGLEKLIAKKRDLKQAAMQQLLTGQTRLPGFSGGWLVINLGHVATFLKGKGLPKSALTSDGVDSCIHYGELFTHYAEIVGEITSRTNGTRDSFRSVANDVLMPTSDVTPRGLAKASCVTLNNVILGGDILVIRSDPSRVFGAFLSYVIRREEDQVLRLVTGSTVYHLYGSDMKKFKFALPSVPEQIAISTLLSEMDVELTTLESRLAKTRDLKQGMMQELLTGRIRLA
jgi:type I restriction enzyme S subunit